MIWRSVTLAVIGLTTGLAGMWLGDRDPPTVIRSTTLTIPKVAPGDMLFIDYQVYRSRACGVEVNRLLFDGKNTRYPLDDIKSATALGRLGEDTYRVPIQIPDRMAPGLARYITTSTYRCNILHYVWPIIVQGQPIQFEVGR